MHHTLGVALYRAGVHREAIEALRRSVELNNNDLNAYDGFFLAMAHWQLGEREQARAHFHRAVYWVQANRPNDSELGRFDQEARQLLAADLLNATQP